MGTVNFNTTVNKNIDLNKQVDLNVAKDVLSTVDIRGNLATAEASADAVGDGDGTGGGTGERIKVPFNVDGFTEGQIASANGVIGPNPDTNGPIAVTDTQIPGLQRTLFTQVLTDDGEASLAVNDILPGKLSYDQGNNTAGNAFADYNIPGGFDPFPLDDNAGIIQDFLDHTNPNDPLDLTDVCYTFTFSDIDWDSGEGQDLDGDGQPEPATLRVSFWVEDTSGNTAIQTVLFVPGTESGTGFQDLSLTGAFATLIDENLANAIPPGTLLAGSLATGAIVALGTEDDVDNNTEKVDFNNLAGFQILLEDDPTRVADGNPFATASIPGFELGAAGFAENPSVNGTDASTRFSWTTCVEEEEFGLLAETDTFAQVQPGGAFSFSEALAASTPVVVDSFDFV